MTKDEVVAAYTAQAGMLADVLGPTVRPGDPEREAVVDWAAGVPGRILDVGSGTGRWSGLLAELGYDVGGLEPVGEFVELARSNYPDVTFRQAVIEDLAGSEERWAGLLAWYTLIHLDLDGLSVALATLRGALADDGQLLMSFFAGPEEEPFDHPATTAWLWPVPEVEQRLELNGFEVTGKQGTLSGPFFHLTARAVS